MSGFGYNILGFGGGGPPPPEVDDEFNRTSFLSHFDGANNGDNNAFDDGSASNHTITANGNVTQGSFGPFARPEGEWAVSFSGAATSDITGPTSSDFQFGDNSFTVECFIFPTVIDNYNVPIGTSGADGAGRWYISYGSPKIYWGTYGNGSDGDLTVDHDMTIGDWYHLAYVRNKSDDKGRMYINGVQKGVWDDARTYGDPAHTLKIGKDFFTDRNNNMNGLISNARVVNGTAVYTSNNFTPPTSPLTAITNTKLLTLQSNRIIDNSASAHALTINGATPVSAFGPFLTDAAYDPAVNGASLYAPTYTDYLRIPNSADFELDANFSVEFWVNLDSKFNSNSGSTAVMFWADNNNQTQIAQNSDTELYFYRGGNTIANTNVLIDPHSWNHIALCRSGSVLSYYCNGVRIGTASYTPTVDFSDGYVMTYVPNANQYGADGYMSDLRILKGSSAYDASQTTLTVPTAPLTAITNTKLLLNMADGQAIDSTAQHNLTLYGGAKLSTGQAKFGDTSIVFDGQDTNYAVVNDFAQLKGELTIEFWVYPSALDPKNGLFQQGFAAGGLSARIETDGTLSLDKIDVSNYLGTSTTISANAWTHIALVYYSGVFKCYINGTADNQTSTTSANWTTSGDEFILGGRYANGASNNPMTGYLDEFRISAFARYTSNFTVQAEQFADQGQV